MLLTRRLSPPAGLFQSSPGVDSSQQPHSGAT